VDPSGERGLRDPSALRPEDRLTTREAETRIGGVHTSYLEARRQENLALRNAGVPGR
jgi:hypothetical protein